MLKMPTISEQRSSWSFYHYYTNIPNLSDVPTTNDYNYNRSLSAHPNITCNCTGAVINCHGQCSNCRGYRGSEPLLLHLSPFFHMTLMWTPTLLSPLVKKIWAEATWPPLLLGQFEHWSPDPPFFGTIRALVTAYMKEVSSNNQCAIHVDIRTHVMDKPKDVKSFQTQKKS